MSELEKEVEKVNDKIRNLQARRLLNQKTESSQLVAQFEDAKDRLVAAFDGMTKLHQSLTEDAGDDDADGEGGGA